MVRSGFDWSQLPKVRDSKKITEIGRNKIFRQMQALRRQERLWFAVAYASHALIDEIGITKAVHAALEKAIFSLKASPQESAVYLDGLLKAPAQFKRQQTIIGGDDVLPIISLAAIAAKVSRDRLLIRLSKKYPGYGLEIHKGYPTRTHRDAIVEKGLSAIHRVTYCKTLISTEKTV